MLKEIYLVSTPIGNMEDITLRAINILTSADAILIEDYRPAKKLLDLLKINHENKELYELNEHTEQKSANALLEKILFTHKKVAMISDGGTPVIADPGSVFIQKALEYGLVLRHVPGASSILGAVQISGFDANNFLFAGFMPRKEHFRQEKLQKLLQIRATILLLETPYRLKQLLGSLKKIGNPNIKLAIVFNITTKKEYVFRGSLKEALQKFDTPSKKDQFVVVIDNNKIPRRR